MALTEQEVETMGDLAGADGYGLYSVIDNRAGDPRPDVTNMLVQVSQVVHWTRRDEWLARVL